MSMIRLYPGFNRNIEQKDSHVFYSAFTNFLFVLQKHILVLFLMLVMYCA